MNEFRRFMWEQLDSRTWEPKELIRRSGLHRQLIWKILKDDRPVLPQIPHTSTLEGIARGFDIPVERVRTAAARAVRGYKDSEDAAPLAVNLRDVSADELLAEVRRRIVGDQPVASRHRVDDGVDEWAAGWVPSQL